MSIAGAPIGVFDSGVGGLSVLRAVRAVLPGEDLIYLADQHNVPYGPRPVDEIQQFAREITGWLLAQGCKLIVVACNTASTAALHHLRNTFPEMPFVGMEPAVKPAAERSRTGVVGVLATPTTLQGAMYASVVSRFANGVTVLDRLVPGLVEAIEAGQVDDEATRQQLQQAIQPLLAAKADMLVLGCTHYPFAAEAIRAITGPQVELIDPAPAVARQVARVLAGRGWLRGGDVPGSTRYYTTGPVATFCRQVELLLGEPVPDCEQVGWPLIT